ncbi:MAG: T9SS type A sorting domain-containing protein [Flavobacteriales bacterium]|nr:MAG: T9SS type A sorting domain-containing protein [Flavobacteriales bacterium]
MVRPFAVVLFSTGLVHCAAQQIPNGGFEDWSDRAAYEEIDEWRTTNYQIPGVISVTRVPGHSGANAARMTSVSNGTNTTYGLLLQGNVVNNQAVDGVPFGTAIDALQGWFRYDIVPGDSAFIYLLVWSGGTVVDTLSEYIGGTQLTWTALSFPVNNGVPVQPDSVLLAFVSSDPYGLPIAGTSWLEVDDVQLTSTIEPVPDELPNNGMEDWHDITTEEPDGWFSFNPLLVNMGLAPVAKSTNARTGSFSLRMETLGLGNDTLPGILANSDIANGAFLTGVPYTDTPTLMTAFYQYEPVGTDTGGIYMAFVSNGLLVQETYAWITNATSAWTFIGSPITLFNAPDTLLLRIWSGSHPGSVLYVDDLSFVGVTLGEEELAQQGLELYPQPTHDVLNVRTVNGDVPMRIRVTDLSGRIVLDGAATMQGSNISLSVNGLAPGVHVLELEFPSGSRRARFVKE